VHSIAELAALAQAQLGEAPSGYPGAAPPGYAAPPQAGPVPGPPGYAGPPQAGPVPGPPGFDAPPQVGPVPGPPGFDGPPQAGPVPGPPGSAGATPGWAQQPRSGPLPGPWGRRGTRSSRPVDSGGDALASLEGDIAAAATGAAVRFLGRAISKRMQRTFDERVRPALAARQEALLHEQIAIAERHPDLRACLTDKVIFLAGGTRTVPMSGMAGMLTLEQSDALVAQLRGS
jgi:hypothetical protein